MGKSTERTNAHQDVTAETLTAFLYTLGGGGAVGGSLRSSRQAGA